MNIHIYIYKFYIYEDTAIYVPIPRPTSYTKPRPTLQSHIRTSQLRTPPHCSRSRHISVSISMSVSRLFYLYIPFLEELFLGGPRNLQFNRNCHWDPHPRHLFETRSRGSQIFQEALIKEYTLDPSSIVWYIT